VKCVDVKNLFNILDKEENKISTTRKILESKMGELEKLENKLSITPQVRFYE
jgi:hypothetical protein